MKLVLVLLLPALAWAQSETHELTGQLGSRQVLLILHSSRAAEGGWQLAGEYLVLPTFQRRFVEGESSPEIGVTSLREGNTPILFGRPPTAELRGTWRGGVFKGARYAPGGQERERFELSEEFPSLESYSASIRCDAAAGRYASTLNLAVDAGRLRSLEWRSHIAPSGHACNVSGAQQQPMKGGLRFVAGACTLTLREVGDYLRLGAENCSEQCGSQAYLEPLFIDRRGRCQVLGAEAR